MCYVLETDPARLTQILTCLAETSRCVTINHYVLETDSKEAVKSIYLNKLDKQPN